MKKIIIVLMSMSLLWTASAVAQPTHEKLTYPVTTRDDVVNDYFGTKVAAPYEWMENLDSPAVKQWVDDENKLTFSYLDKIPQRDAVRQRLKQLWNYEKVGVPQMRAGRLFFSMNTGLQNQSVVYEQVSPGGKPRELLDPNTLSPNGDIALLNYEPSDNGDLLAYALSQGGSDWETLHVRDLKDGKSLTDEVRYVKFSGISWTKDDKGFFYSRYPAPPAGQAISQQVKDQALYYHVLGTPQSDDKLIYARPDLPEWIVGGQVSENGRYLFVVLVNGTSPNNELYYADLGDPQQPDIAATIKPLFTKNDAAYYPIGNLDDRVFLQTTRDAPRDKIVSFKLTDPEHWSSVVPETENVIESSLMANHKVVVQYLVDVKSELRLFSSAGKAEGRVSLPGIGAVVGLSGRNDSKELYYGFTSYLYPTTVYRYDLASGKNAVFFKPQLTFDPSRYETRQVFYRSKDGTRIPMFITYRKGLKLDGGNPTLLYAYGGFDISITPSFNPLVPVWLEMGGVYAVANLRGGGEYGEAWHLAGMLGKKQNVFNDFVWAAKYLIAQKYTSPKKLAIWGYSNGGLLIGATITQHPELFGAAYAGAGVMDMLRYQKFSGGALWAPEYGTSSDPKAFKWLIKYSPLQNLKAGDCYPPTIITTSDHDDRVVPSHSYKFAAALQHDQGCSNPVLIRVETQTSHNYMPTDKRIIQWSDVWAFLAYNLGITTPPEQE
ncbi:MAG TPA: prolyl oligopeptidase family serine peptidase [Gammaproteobacteria bacterium]|nr:prolyl oligopeptidase family serine peptidase [Gammaproteobacteria bacterium]